MIDKNIGKRIKKEIWVELPPLAQKVLKDKGFYTVEYDPPYPTKLIFLVDDPSGEIINIEIKK